MRKYDDFNELMENLNGISLNQAKKLKIPYTLDHNGYAGVAKFNEAIEIRDQFGLNVISYIISEGEDSTAFTYNANGEGPVSYVNVELYLFCLSAEVAQSEDSVQDNEILK